jgi:hypothetical protein
VLFHVYATAGLPEPERLFVRAVAQSPAGPGGCAPEDVRTVHAAGYALGRALAATGAAVSASDADALRALPVERLVAAGSRYAVRAVDTRAFFPEGWRAALATGAPHTAPIPVIIGDSSLPAGSAPNGLYEWTAPSLLRRLNAVLGCRRAAGALARAYELSALMPAEELPSRLVELVADARVGWPAERAAALLAKSGAGRVWRYVWDQEPTAPAERARVPGEVAYLFDAVPAPPAADDLFDGAAVFEDLSDDEADALLAASVASSRSNSSSGSFSVYDAPPPVDRWTLAHVREALQATLLSFAHGKEPWAPQAASGRVYVFGPEGECGERGKAVFDGRRRVGMWSAAFRGIEGEVLSRLAGEVEAGPCV